jgi:hypothetical protein
MTDTKRHENGVQCDRTTARLLHDLAESAVILNCRQRWLMMELRAGRLPGRKVHRQWRMSDADIQAAIELCAVAPQQSAAPSLADQLTERSRRATG